MFRSVIISVIVFFVIIGVPSYYDVPFQFEFYFFSALTSSLAVLVVNLSPSKDAFESIKLPLLLFAISYAAAPVFITETDVFKDSFYQPLNSGLFEYGAKVVFFCELTFLAGYYLSAITFGTNRTVVGEVGKIQGSDLASTKNTRLFWFSVFVLLVGLLSYISLVLQSGGIGHFLSYSGGRGEIFSGTFGAFYWGAFFMLSGMVMLIASFLPNYKFIALAAVLCVSGAYFLFQGRSLALAPMFCGLILFHYFIKRLSGWFVVSLSLVGIILASFFGFFRTIENKSKVYQDPFFFISYFSENIGEFLQKTIISNIQQFDLFMVAVIYVEKTGDLLDGATLTNWLEPLDRLLHGELLDSVHAGKFLLQVVDPEFKALETAASPSLIGELYINYSTIGSLFGFFLYGFILRSLYNPIARKTASKTYYAFYTYCLWVFSKSIVDGTMLWFKLATFAAPIILFMLFMDKKEVRQYPEKKSLFNQ